MKRKAISASVRWSVFARDGFRCRYCGEQASDYVTLAVDHIISVADGGDNAMDNLLTACRRCNSGKGPRSLSGVPVSVAVLEAATKQAENAEKLSLAIRRTISAKAEVNQQIVNMKCAAYAVDSVRMNDHECEIVGRLIEEFGTDLVMSWYSAAAAKVQNSFYAIKYVCGCARTHREQIGGAA